MCCLGNVHFVNIEDMIGEDEGDPVIGSYGSDDEQLESLDAAAHTQAKPKLIKGSSSDAYGSKRASPKDAGQVRASMATAEVFEIPELPRGQHLVCNILSTWGDPFYVGLMGIEVFDHTGHAVHLSDVDKQLSADPPDLNALHGDHKSHNDPRTVDKLVDNHYFTCDELHAWLAPFTRGQNHFVYLDFDYALSVSMIRIWNYNTTRIHSYRGARYMEISLDGRSIFKGEIRRAPGCVTEDVDSCNECILFTTNSSILQLIEKYEKQRAPVAAVSAAHAAALSHDGQDAAAIDTRHLERPKTGNKTHRSGNLHFANGPVDSLSFNGPASSAYAIPDPSKGSSASHPSHGVGFLAASRPCTAPIVCDQAAEKPVACKSIALVLEANWGDPYEIGLAGLQFLDANYLPLKISLDQATVRAPFAEPRLKQLVESFGARHLTTDPEQMWCAPYKNMLAISSKRRAITIDFRQSVNLRAIKLWNYNATLEDSFKGAKRIAVYLDQVKHSSFSLRKAPGNTTDFDFGQFLYLHRHTQAQHSQAPEVYALRSIGKPESASTGPPSPLAAPSSTRSLENDEDEDQASGSSATLTQTDLLTMTSPSRSNMKPISEIFQQYQTPLFPTGYIVKFVFMSTWGDAYYIGLNALELFDERNNLVQLRDDLIGAQPRDINVLKEPGQPHDVRTLDKLYDGVNNTYDDRHMWLAPFTPTQSNKLLLFFNDPITLSKIRLWNYSKTPTRGVREFEVFLDDVLIFHGTLKPAPALVLPSDDTLEQDHAMDNRRLRKKRYEQAEAAAAAVDMTQTILFTDDPEILDMEAGNIYVPEEELEESVTFYDNSQVLSLSDAPHREAMVRPTTSAGTGMFHPNSSKSRGAYR